MTSFQIFGVQFLLSLLGYGLIARWYVAPRLAALPLHDALIPLILPHAFRHLGLVFLVPTVVRAPLPGTFALPTAYGDLLTVVLALLAVVALRIRWPIAIPLVWLFNIVGTLDFIHAFYQGIRLRVDLHLGAAWYIPTFGVPALFITHVMIFVMLIRRSR